MSRKSSHGTNEAGEGTLLGRDTIEAEIILKGEGVKDILAHLTPKAMGLHIGRIIGRKLEIKIND